MPLNCFSNVRLIATVIFIIDVIILIIVLGILWTTEKTDSECKHICLPDAYGRYLCKCRAELTSNYLKSVFEEQFRARDEEIKGEKQNIYGINDWLPSMKPNARLGGDDDKFKDENQNSSGMVTLKSWRDNGNNMFLSNGVRFRNGRLVVPYEGVYHVYSFVDMRLDKYENGHPQKSNIRQSIFKSNIRDIDTDSEETELISSFRPYEVNADIAMKEVYDTYFSCDVHLKAGDEVYVKVNDKKFIRYPKTNSFGIRLL